MKRTVKKLPAALAFLCAACALAAHDASASSRAPAHSATTAQTMAPDDSLLVVFWNVENFFHYRSDSPHRHRYLTRKRFYAKCAAICKTLLLIADEYGRMPDVVAFAEVENASVMHALLSSSLLRKDCYGLVHYDSPDRRGIDCCLIYRKDRLTLEDSFLRPMLSADARTVDTRGFMWARFDALTVLLNHHPSKVGGSQREVMRSMAMEQMRFVADSLMRAGGGRGVLSMGDFNDCLWGERPPEECTIKYDGHWEKIDGCFTFGPLEIRERVWFHPSLLTPDRAFGGMKPLRSFTGPRYNGGVSDHLPIVMSVRFR